MTMIQPGRPIRPWLVLALGLLSALGSGAAACQGSLDEPAAPRANGPDLRVDASAGRHAISPLIYGLNFPDEALALDLALPVARWGGNSVTRYNWTNDTYNTASDWYFQNIPNTNARPADLPNGSASDRFVEQNRRTGTASILTIPMIGWVAKRRTGGHPYDCGFSIAKYGAQQDRDPWDPDCGNGVKANGQPVTGNDPRDTSVAVEPDFAADWVAHLRSRFRAAGEGPLYYNLDNEPMLWNSTHRDVHPEPLGYDELLSRGTAYAAAIKRADPAALTLGPVFWGWTAYWYSAADQAGGGSWWDRRPDRRAHGDMPLAPWYLSRMRAAEDAGGTRLLDFFDLHFYPQAQSVALSQAGDAATQALRLRSTRALWDPDYADESWIAQTEGGPAVKLIPRMRAWVDEHYPGTRLAITEYNWGGLEHINGALAQADILGIFGREGLGLATLWSPPKADEPGAFAFRAYRNYDSAGAMFGETGVAASSADQGRLSVYGALRAGDGALTVVVINKTGEELSSRLGLEGFRPGGLARVFRYSAKGLTALRREPDMAVASSGFSADYPAESITVIELALAGEPTVEPTDAATSTASPMPPAASVTPAPTAPGGRLWLPWLAG